MDKVNIQGVILTPLNCIQNDNGDIYHGLRKSELAFKGFGEVYFTTVNHGYIKGWNKHKKMTINLIVPVGDITVIICDKREISDSTGKYLQVQLSKSNYQRLTIPPGLWFAFKGNNKNTNLMLNVADIEHDPNEIERLELHQIKFNWESL